MEYMMTDSFYAFANDKKDVNTKQPHWLRNRKGRTWGKNDIIAKKNRINKRRAKKKAA